MLWYIIFVVSLFLIIVLNSIQSIIRGKATTTKLENKFYNFMDCEAVNIILGIVVASTFTLSFFYLCSYSDLPSEYIDYKYEKELAVETAENAKKTGDFDIQEEAYKKVMNFNERLEKYKADSKTYKAVFNTYGKGVLEMEPIDASKYSPFYENSYSQNSKFTIQQSKE